MKITMALLALALSGCVSQKTMLVNAHGETVHCDQWGFGILGVPVALVEHDQCIKTAKAAGYADSVEAARQNAVLDCSKGPVCK